MSTNVSMPPADDFAKAAAQTRSREELVGLLRALGEKPWPAPPLLPERLQQMPP